MNRKVFDVLAKDGRDSGLRDGFVLICDWTDKVRHGLSERSDAGICGEHPKIESGCSATASKAPSMRTQGIEVWHPQQEDFLGPGLNAHGTSGCEERGRRHPQRPCVRADVP